MRDILEGLNLCLPLVPKINQGKEIQRENLFRLCFFSFRRETEEGNKSECLQSNYLHILMTFSLSCMCCLKYIPYGIQLQDFTGCQCRKEIPDMK